MYRLVWQNITREIIRVLSVSNCSHTTPKICNNMLALPELIYSSTCGLPSRY